MFWNVTCEFHCQHISSVVLTVIALLLAETPAIYNLKKIRLLFDIICQDS